MSMAVSNRLYGQIEGYFASDQSRPGIWDRLSLFGPLRAIDIALAVSAAVAATAAGANAAGVPLTSEILRNAAVGGALKSGATAFVGLVMLVMPRNKVVDWTLFPMALGTSFAINVLLVATIAIRTLGYAPSQLLVAAVVASLPLSFAYVAFYCMTSVPITLPSIGLDVLGAYTFVKMADNLGYPVCPATPALIAGAVFGAIFASCSNLVSCWLIGNLNRTEESGYGHHFSHEVTFTTTRTVTLPESGMTITMRD